MDVIETRERGYTDFAWLKLQAEDDRTLELIDQIEDDENKFIALGVVTEGDDLMTLRMKQGVFHTTRRTSHTLASIFVQIFKCQEHTQVKEFDGDSCDVIVDIGANEGYYALNVARNGASKIIAIEPNPVAYELLCRNVDSNNFTNIYTENFAVWDREGVANFSIIPQVTSVGTLSVSDTSFLSKARERVVEIPVKTVTLGNLMQKYELSKIDVLKIDVEGGEMNILKNSIKELESVDRIVMEYHSQDIRTQAVLLLESLGFSLVLHVPDRSDFGDLYFKR